MRYRSICAAVLGIITLAGANLLADPAAQPAGPAPQAAQPAPVCDVYLIPFTPLGNDNSLDWVGKAVQQNLLTDLARAKLHPLGSDKPIANSSDAQAAARAAGAKYLITGTYQVADQQLRFNGQVIDPTTGNVLGGISTTGAVRDLFALEDALSSQAVQQLAQLPGFANANNKLVAGAPAPAAAPPVPPVVVQIVQPPATPAIGTKYQGSALEQYVNSNRNPSADYSQPPDISADDNYASTPGNNYNVDFGTTYSGYGLGYGYGFGLFYPLPPYGKYGYGTDGHHHHHGDTPEH